MINVVVRYADLPEHVRVDWVAARLQGEDESFRSSFVGCHIRLHNGRQGRVLKMFTDGSAFVVLDNP